MKSTFSAAACLFIGLALPRFVAAQPAWIPLAEGKSRSYELRVGSLERMVTEKTNDPILVVTVRSTDKASETVSLQKNYVRIAHCRARQGKVVTTDINGRYQFDNDFMFDGGNIASTIAELICTAGGIGAEQGQNAAPTTRF